MKKISVKKIAQLTGHKGGVFSLAQSHPNHLFLSGAGDGWIVEWDLTKPKDGALIALAEDNQTGGKASIFSLLRTFMPKEGGSAWYIAGNMNGGLHWIYPRDKSFNKDVLHHKKGVFDIQFFDKAIYTTGGEGVLSKWSLETQRPMESIQLSGESLRRMSFSKERNELAVGASDGNVYIIDLSNFSLKNTIKGAHDNSVFAVHYSPDGKFLWSGGRDAHLKVWDLKQLKTPIFSEPAHWFTINSIVFSPDGKFAATGSRDKTIKIWDVENLKLLKVLDATRNGGHVNSVNTLLWTSYNNWLVSGSDDRSLIVWEIK